jgi:hypothetical protein
MFRPPMVAIVRLYILKLANCCNMQIQFGVEISNTITLIGFTVSACSKYMATTHPAYTPHHYTQATYHPVYFHTPQNGQDPPRLGAHTHQPIDLDHAHQEASKKRLTSPLQTTISTDYTLTVLLLTVKPTNFMVFEISTSNCIGILQQFTSFSVYNLTMASMGGRNM